MGTTDTNLLKFLAVSGVFLMISIKFSSEEYVFETEIIVVIVRLLLAVPILQIWLECEGPVDDVTTVKKQNEKKNGVSTLIGVSSKYNVWSNKNMTL